jgi:hypothetical protein
MDMTNLHRSPPMNQSKTDLGIVNESQLLRFGIRGFVVQGASVIPAAAALRRATIEVRTRARDVGCPFPTLRIERQADEIGR